ncbi:MAG: ATP-binding protein, partial [bacterium]
RQRERMEKMAKDLEVAFKGEKSAKEKIDAIRVEDEALLGSIGDGVVAVDKEGKVMFVNRAAEEMLDFKSEQVIEKPYEQILEMQNEKGEILVKEKNPLYQDLNSGKKIVTDASGTPEKTIYFVKNDKTKFPAAITVAPVILQGKTIGAVNVFRDITVERRIDKSKSEFVSLASHQLRTPLTAIKWYAEMLMSKKTGKLGLKQKKYLDVIYDGNMRMIKLIDIMLDVSRLDAGKVKIRNELSDIKKVAEIIIEEEKVNIKKRKQKFVFECEEKEMKTVTDPNQLRIVFQNVISNAVKYTPEAGRIVCSIKRDGDNFLLSIKDSGIGIPKDQQKRIFEKLFRADNAFSHQPDGNGLGLYAAKATIENLGGKIWFESKEGEGTMFFVTIPIKN